MWTSSIQLSSLWFLPWKFSSFFFFLLLQTWNLTTTNICQNDIKLNQKYCYLCFFLPITVFFLTYVILKEFCKCPLQRTPCFNGLKSDSVATFQFLLFWDDEHIFIWIRCQNIFNQILMMLFLYIYFFLWLKKNLSAQARIMLQSVYLDYYAYI